MIELTNEVVVILAVGAIFSTIIVRTLNFLLKSRCSTIKCCGGECVREVITEQNISKDIIKEIEIPSNLVKIKK